MRHHTALLTAALLGCSLAAGCSGSSKAGPDSTRYASGGTFTMAIAADFGIFDPYRNGLWAYSKLAYDSLVNQQPDGKVVSGLAEKWNVDARGATFTLRSGVTCSDGVPLTASQVAADLTWLGDPKNKAPIYGTLVPTVPYTVTADNASRTVRVVAKRPFGFLLDTIGQAPIMCAKGLQNPDLLKTGSDGTGPFVLTKVVTGQTWTFTRRDGYAWGPGGVGTGAAGTPANVVLKLVSSETTRVNLLLSGQVNLGLVTGPDAARLDARKMPKLDVPQSGAWLTFNQIGDRITKDKQVRQALVGALDLNEIVKVNTGGTGSAATGLVTMQPKPCTGDTVKGRLLGHDPAAAAQALDQAGWRAAADGTRSKDGKRLTIDLHYGTFAPLDKPTAELIAQKWKALGIKVDLSADAAAVGNEIMYKSHDFDVYMAGFGFRLPSDMVPFFSGPIPPAGLNVGGVDNPAFNAMAAKANTYTAPQACQYWSQAEQALFADLDVVPIASRPWHYYLHKADAQTAGFDLPIPATIRLLD